MTKSIKVLKYFDKVEGAQDLNEEQFRVLKHGDDILVQLDGAQPEIRKFIGFGVRSPLIATPYKGCDYTYFFLTLKTHGPNTIATLFIGPGFAG